MATTNAAALGEFRHVPINSLRLDALNPRLPDRYRNASQERLAETLELGFEAYAVAESIADSGYFLSEPLLVIESPDEPECWIVVEGNRRLTALIGLTNPSIRKDFAEPDLWEAAAARSGLSGDNLVPVVVHTSRESTHREVGKAHVVGKLRWQPYAQAMYIAARVAEGRSFEDVADLLGMPKSKVADMYRDQAVVKQAQSNGLDTEEIEAAFSLLTVAMSSTKIRNHVGAPLGTQLKPGAEPIPADKLSELAETITWIFGSEDEAARIADSRQISQLGNVIANEIGLAALRAGDSLAAAKEKVHSAGMDPLDRLKQRLEAAKNALLAASDDLGDFAEDPIVLALVDDLEAVMEGLRTLGAN